MVTEIEARARRDSLITAGHPLPWKRVLGSVILAALLALAVLS
jgi:hypothetical protein